MSQPVKLPLFFPARETGNLKINMAEADLSPTTFTSSSVSDFDYDISLRIPLKIETKIDTLKLPVIIIIRPRKQCKALSLQEFDDVKADQPNQVVIP